MRNLLSNLVAPFAANGWLRAGILVLLLTTFAALAAPTTAAEVDAQEAVTAVQSVDVVAARPRFDSPPQESTDGVHAWAG